MAMTKGKKGKKKTRGTIGRANGKQENNFTGFQ